MTRKQTIQRLSEHLTVNSWLEDHAKGDIRALQDRINGDKYDEVKLKKALEAEVVSDILGIIDTLSKYQKVEKTLLRSAYHGRKKEVLPNEIIYCPAELNESVQRRSNLISGLYGIIDQICVDSYTRKFKRFSKYPWQVQITLTTSGRLADYTAFGKKDLMKFLSGFFLRNSPDARIGTYDLLSQYGQLKMRIVESAINNGLNYLVKVKLCNLERKGQL